MTNKAKDTSTFPLPRRIVIENVQPEIEGGRFPIKRVTGERVEVTADVYADGHDVVYAVLRHRSPSRAEWQEVAMQALANDRWKAESNTIVTVVNLDPYHTQSGWMDLSLESLGLDPHQPYQMHDPLSDARYLWHGPHNYVQLDPTTMPAHIFRIRRRVCTERDFDYFL
jgi:hypothetical protein